MSNYDIVIAGGGLVGASLAVALGGSGKRILVVEPYPPDSGSQQSFDTRTVALTYSAKLIFQGMGVWEDIEKTGIQPIIDIHITDKGHFGQTHLSCEHVGTSALGYVVPTQTIGDVLWKSMSRLPNVEVLCPGQVSDITISDALCEMAIDHESITTAASQLMVIADGGRSELLNIAGFKRQSFPYLHSAILSIITTDRPHNGRAYERFTRDGPIALLPHSTIEGKHRYAVVWTTRNNEVDDRMALDDSNFIEQLQYSFGDRAGLFDNPSPRKAYPLERSRLTSAGCQRVVAVGNAAHTVHPVAGQGFNLGLRDVAALADLIVSAGDSDAGAQTLVNAYLQSRRQDIAQVEGFTHSLIHLFSHDNSVIKLGRNMGLKFIEHFPPAKRFLLRRTMGLSGHSSSLALGLPLSPDC